MTTSNAILISGLLLSPSLLQAQYRLDWFQIGAGGGHATGSLAALSSTIGQSGVDTSHGGAFQCVGGFWSFISPAPTPGAPRLSIARVGDSVEVSWPAAAGDFVLQETDTLDNYPAVEWRDASYPYRTNGTQIVVTLPLPNTGAGGGRPDDVIRIPAKRVVKIRSRK